MNKEIHNLKELNALGRDLKIDDEIYFTTKNKTFRYQIWDCHVINKNDTDNNAIFKYLRLDREETKKLAEKNYGYNIKRENMYNLSSSDWPEFEENDFRAIERLIREIYKLLGDDSDYNLSERIISRFEILDL